MAPTEHLKMMRLLFLCLLLLLPAATAFSEDTEGSGDYGEDDDEDTVVSKEAPNVRGSAKDKTTVANESPDQLTLIIIIVAVAVLTLSIAVIVTIMLVRRHMHNQQQGIYFVPTEQDQKGAV